MNMNKRIILKLISVLLICSMVVPMTGCSELLKKIAGKSASKALEDVLDAFYADPVNGITDFDAEYAIPELSEGALALAVEGVSSTSYTIGNTKINKNRDEAKITVTFSDVRVIEDLPMATEEEVRELIDDCELSEFDVTFILEKDDDEWKLVDEGDLIDVFFAPYQSVVFVDEHGMPTSFYGPFFEDAVVETVWYDPVMGNPISSGLSSPEALEAVVYFDRPIYLTFTANLYKNDELVQSVEVSVEGSTTAFCDFWGERYSNGNYTCELVFDNGVVAESGDIRVS